MRKSYSVLISVIMMTLLLFGGCGKEQEEVFVPDEPEVTEREETAENEETEEEVPTEVPEETSDAYTGSSEDSPNVGYVILGVGSNETEASATWYSKSANAGKMLVAKASEMNGGAFPQNALLAESVPESAGYEDYQKNRATVAGLEPDTQYCYMVGNDEGWSAVRTFHTTPEDEVKVIVTGDIEVGVGDENHVNVDNWARIAADTSSRFADYGMHLNMGDVTYVPDESHYPDTIDVPLFQNFRNAVVRGNHDYGSVYYNHFFQPNLSEFGQEDDEQNGNFWFREGDVLFMQLNYQVEGVDILLDHRYFVAGALEANPDCKWKVVIMHYSPFSSTEKYQDYSNENRDRLMEVFDEFGIDAVFAGHDHVYTRTPIIKAGQLMTGDVASVTNPDGTLYVNFSSSSGSQYHVPAPNPFGLRVLQTNTPHISTLNFTDTRMKLTVYEADTWNVIDEFEIIKE